MLPWGATNAPMRWWHVALRSGGQVGESSMRRSCGISDGYSGRHLAPPLVRHDKLTRGRPAWGASRWGRLIPGWPRSRRFSSRWLPGGSQGGYGGVHGVSSQLSRGFEPLELRACSWLVESVLLWIDEVSWPRRCLCGSTSPRVLVWVPSGPHDALCISLSSELQSRQMIYPFRSSQRAHHNGGV
jgi:hypothetical protein